MPNLKEQLIKLLKTTITDISVECSDDEVGEAIALINPHRYGFFRESDFANAEDCMKYLGVKSRKRFFELTKECKVTNKKVNNMPIGFRKKEIERIYFKLYSTKKKFI